MFTTHFPGHDTIWEETKNICGGTAIGVARGGQRDHAPPKFLKI